MNQLIRSRSPRAFAGLAPVLASLALLAPAFAQDPGREHSKAPDARKWEFETSDIPVDPRIHFGWLHNGMRYAWMQNGEPKKRCYLRLHVNAGSLGEHEDELGMAHYLEHMVFNGSKHYPAGTLIEWFQRHGMSFGGDTNAGTSFSLTVYEIDLPTSDEQSISEGLVVLRDFADGALFEQKEIDNERGVIDAEERERDSPDHRILVRSWKTELAGTRIPEREPIGVKAVRDTFTTEKFQAFYKRWYRAENFTLILVGDLGSFDPSKLIESTFADARSPSDPLEKEPPVGTPTLATKTFVVSEPDASAVGIRIHRVIPWKEKPDDKAHTAEDLPLDMARSMLNLRFEELAKKEGAPFLGAGVGSLRGELRAEDGESLSISCAPEKWSEALAACEPELRRAIEFGFDESELAEVKADTLRGLDEAVAREKTQSSQGLVEQLVDAAEDRVVTVSATTQRALEKPLLEALTAKQCSETFAEAWKKGTLLVEAAGKIDLGPDGAKKLQDAYEASAKTPVEARKKEEEKPFAYVSDPAKAGAVASRSHVDEFDVEEVTFENGVKLRMKKTDFKEKQLLVSVLVGEGELTAEPKQQALSTAVGETFELGGLGAHSADDLRRLNAGRVIGVGFGIGPQSFNFSGGTTKEDLVRELELVRAYMTDPGWREDGLRQFQKSIPLFFDSLDHRHGGPITRQFVPEYHSGDERFRFPERSEFEAVTIPAMKDWLAPRLGDAPIDVALVGDLDVDAAIAAVAQTLGTLPKRRGPEAHEENRKPVDLKAGLRRSYEIDTEVPKTLVLIFFPTADGRDVTMRRRLSFLSDVLGDRLRVSVREKLGATYSPGAGAQLGEVYPNDGTIVIQCMSDPDKVDALVDACLQSADDMATKGLNEDEVDRQRKPAQANVRDTVRKNGYWLDELSRLHSIPSVFDEMRTLAKFYDDVKVADLDPLAKEYLKKERASVAIVAPNKKTTVEAKSGAETPPKKKEE
jgi:zinc protease